MAKWEYRGKGNAVSVYQIIEGKLVRLPRNKTRHLDGLSEAAIDEWVTQWSALNAVAKIRPDLAKVPTDWQMNIQAFETYLLVERKRDPKTVKDHIRHLNAALPYFAQRDCQTYSDFLPVARGLGEWLARHSGKSARRIYAINQSIGVFWK
jgi:hypothetical protein